MIAYIVLHLVIFVSLSLLYIFVSFLSGFVVVSAGFDCFLGIFSKLGV